MTEVQREVIALVAKERGLARDNVKLSSRLRRDLGMDGDDAVEFFQEFEERYGVDLSPLYRRWDRHFGPEGYGNPRAFLIAIALLFSPLPLLPFGVSPVWVWGIAIVALLLWRWPLRWWPWRDTTIAVSVQDLVTAAETGKWPLT